jgi:plasmid stability protein
MPTVTLKGVPKRLHQKLKSRASLHRRSLNGEILTCLESVVESVPVDVGTLLRRARFLRGQVSGELNDNALKKLKNHGRP